MARADVEYDSLLSVRFIPKPAISTISWADKGVFDIPPDFYAPPLQGAVRATIRIQIKGNKLSATETRVRRIYDLDTGTLTTIDLQNHTFRVETFDQSYLRLERLLKHIGSYGTDRDFQVAVRKTGRTIRMADEDATEYSIVAITTRHGKRIVAASSTCWSAEVAPSKELDAFRQKWRARTKLPFPDNTVGFTEGAGVDSAMAQAQQKLPGYIVGSAIEFRPVESPIGSEIPTGFSYDASRNDLPFRSTGETGQSATLNTYPTEFFHTRDILITQTALANLSTQLLEEESFTVPSGFKKKK